MQREKPGFEVIPNWLRIFPDKLERVQEQALAPNQKRTASRCGFAGRQLALPPPSPPPPPQSAPPLPLPPSPRATVPRTATIVVVARTVMFRAERLGVAKQACKAPSVAARGKAAIIRRPNRP